MGGHIYHRTPTTVQPHSDSNKLGGYRGVCITAENVQNHADFIVSAHRQTLPALSANTDGGYGGAADNSVVAAFYLSYLQM